jgi:hypothetical protein
VNVEVYDIGWGVAIDTENRVEYYLYRYVITLE